MTGHPCTGLDCPTCKTARPCTTPPAEGEYYLYRRNCWDTGLTHFQPYDGFSAFYYRRGQWYRRDTPNRPWRRVWNQFGPGDLGEMALLSRKRPSRAMFQSEPWHWEDCEAEGQQGVAP